MTENFPDEEELLKAFPPPVDGPDSACAHLKVTVYSRMVSAETWYEPAEYAFKIVCNECGEQFDENSRRCRRNRSRLGR